MSPLWKCQVSPNLIQPMEQRLSLEAAGKAFKENVCACVVVCVHVCESESWIGRYARVEGKGLDI